MNKSVESCATWNNINFVISCELTIYPLQDFIKKKIYKLNVDVLYLIFKEFQDDKRLYSCLSVNKIFFKIIIPILWNNSWKFLELGKENNYYTFILFHIYQMSQKQLKESRS